MYKGIEFFTATCLNWQMLLLPDDRKDILMNSLKFMVEEKRIWLYGFVIMPNHIHLMWRRQDEWLNKSTEQQFLKFTAQQLKFKLIDTHSPDLENYRSTQGDREYHFWERKPYIATMYNRTVSKQKIALLRLGCAKK